MAQITREEIFLQAASAIKRDEQQPKSARSAADFLLEVYDRYGSDGLEDTVKRLAAWAQKPYGVLPKFQNASINALFEQQLSQPDTLPLDRKNTFSRRGVLAGLGVAVASVAGGRALYKYGADKQTQVAHGNEVTVVSGLATLDALSKIGEQKKELIDQIAGAQNTDKPKLLEDYAALSSTETSLTLALRDKYKALSSQEALRVAGHSVAAVGSVLGAGVMIGSGILGTWRNAPDKEEVEKARQEIDALIASVGKVMEEVNVRHATTRAAPGGL